MLTSDQIYQLIQTIITLGLGGLALRIFDFYTSRQKRKEDERKKVNEREVVDNATIRTELWTKVENLEKYVERLHKELNDSKDKYSVLYTEYNILRIKYDNIFLANQELRAEYNSLRSDYDKLKLELEAKANK